MDNNHTEQLTTITTGTKVPQSTDIVRTKRTSKKKKSSRPDAIHDTSDIDNITPLSKGKGKSNVESDMDNDDTEQFTTVTTGTKVPQSTDIVRTKRTSKKQKSSRPDAIHDTSDIDNITPLSKGKGKSNVESDMDNDDTEQFTTVTTGTKVPQSTDIVRTKRTSKKQKSSQTK